MTNYLSPDTPINELSTSDALKNFAELYGFYTIKDLLTVGFNKLHLLEGFDYRLQREVVELARKNNWGYLIE